ncbi:hypothetical protein D3C86_1719320 [compost metagenome]
MTGYRTGKSSQPQMGMNEAAVAVKKTKPANARVGTPPGTVATRVAPLNKGKRLGGTCDATAAGAVGAGALAFCFGAVAMARRPER